MKMNFRGLVNLYSLPKTHSLLPLFEAVINSIQSIEEAKRDDGEIRIEICRERQMSLFSDWETDIEDIIIEDNGIGFTTSNFTSFDTYASDYKMQKGCKGVGRLMWLKAFRMVEIESTFEENGTKKRRTFSFDAEHAVFNEETVEVDENEHICTKVKLLGLSKEYRRDCPKKIETIAKNILNHCFAYFVLGKAPQIVISDGNSSIELERLYQMYSAEHIKIEDFNIRGLNFKVIHSKNYIPSSEKHTINLCADQWVVQSLPLHKLLDNISSKFSDDNGEFVYMGYVLSEVFNQHVNRERTKIELPDQQNLVERVGLDEIRHKLKELVCAFLQDDIEESNKKKYEMVRDYIYKKNPKYRLLLKYDPNLIDNIPWTTDEERLDMELYKKEQKFKLDLKREGKELEQKAKAEIYDYESYMNKRAKYAEKLSDLGKSNLAEYVMHRKAILDILAQNVKYKDQDEKRYAYEKNIHQLIFPMTTTSDDIDYLQHNLWIIDEKLAYHHYLASDTKIKSMQEVESDSPKEPDIMIFDTPFAFTDEETQPYRNITIIEFKRPGREHYSDDDNPIRQVKQYMDDILEGKIRNKDGEFLSSTESIRFFCYIICDIDVSMKKLARLENLKATPDSMGYYSYIDSYKSYLEVIPYNKLIQDSQKRNRILFDKLFNQY